MHPITLNSKKQPPAASEKKGDNSPGNSVSDEKIKSVGQKTLKSAAKAVQNTIRAQVSTLSRKARDTVKKTKTFLEERSKLSAEAFAEKIGNNSLEPQDLQRRLNALLQDFENQLSSLNRNQIPEAAERLFTAFSRQVQASENQELSRKAQELKYFFAEKTAQKALEAFPDLLEKTSSKEKSPFLVSFFKHLEDGTKIQKGEELNTILDEILLNESAIDESFQKLKNIQEALTPKTESEKAAPYATIIARLNARKITSPLSTIDALRETLERKTAEAFSLFQEQPLPDPILEKLSNAQKVFRTHEDAKNLKEKLDTAKQQTRPYLGVLSLAKDALNVHEEILNDVRSLFRSYDKETYEKINNLLEGDKDDTEGKLDEVQKTRSIIDQALGQELKLSFEFKEAEEALKNNLALIEEAFQKNKALKEVVDLYEKGDFYQLSRKDYSNLPRAFYNFLQSIVKQKLGKLYSLNEKEKTFAKIYRTNLRIHLKALAEEVKKELETDALKLSFFETLIQFLLSLFGITEKFIPIEDEISVEETQPKSFKEAMEELQKVFFEAPNEGREALLEASDEERRAFLKGSNEERRDFFALHGG